jgi:K+-sensing histidine kinase KdpD
MQHNSADASKQLPLNQSASRISEMDFSKRIEVKSNDEIDRIWDMFYRSKQNGRQDGSGLGLAIVKKVLELHTSRYGVRNTEDGVCFFFTLKRFNSFEILQ